MKEEKQMMPLSKEEYREKLEAIRDFHSKKYEDFFEAWNAWTVDLSKKLTLSQYSFVDFLIAKELYELSQESGRRKECGGLCCNEKATCHRDEENNNKITGEQENENSDNQTNG